MSRGQTEKRGRSKDHFLVTAVELTWCAYHLLILSERGADVLLMHTPSAAVVHTPAT